jgi:hypothetical protein
MAIRIRIEKIQHLLEAKKSLRRSAIRRVKGFSARMDDRLADAPWAARRRISTVWLVRKCGVERALRHVNSEGPDLCLAADTEISSR